jgi:hypothetical protein
VVSVAIGPSRRMSSHRPACGPVRTAAACGCRDLDLRRSQAGRKLWSPEQISGHLKANGQPGVSHETIYQRIYADKRRGGTLHRTLRCQKARKKRYGARERRGTIPNQVSIEQRPAIVDARTRFRRLGGRSGDRRGSSAGISSPSTSAHPAIASSLMSCQDGCGRVGRHDFLADAFCGLCSYADDR